MIERALGPYAVVGSALEAAGYAAIPIKVGEKKPAVANWQASLKWTSAERQTRFRHYRDVGVGLLAGTILQNGNLLAFIDVDNEGLVSFAERVLGESGPAKTGSKGATFFCQADPTTKSRKFKRKGSAHPAVEVFANSGQTVLPPSRHPNGQKYKWIGPNLLDFDALTLPFLNKAKLMVIERTLSNRYAWEIIEGGPEVKAHDAMLRLCSNGIANEVEDLGWLADCFNALLPSGYSGNTASETLQMLQSAKRKELGWRPHHNYDPGDDGPLPLGYTKDNTYAFLDPTRRIIVAASAQQLLSHQYLLGLSPSSFWAKQFPTEKGFSAIAAGEALIAACKQVGTFQLSRVRGRGIWREGARTIVNLGERIPNDSAYLYLCFENIKFEKTTSFETSRLKNYLEQFRWRNPHDAILMLGWLAIAPICGVLNWRPHCFVFGPPRCGKTTIHALSGTLLKPLVVSTDGQSSEAGIRQTLGPDSLPIIIDEFESDQNGAGLRGVLRLARSASSSENPILRGTPEGKALHFSLRTTFFFCAVNPGRMSPADQTRILMLELLPHDSDPVIAKHLIEEEGHFRSLDSKWCGYMISLAHLIEPALNIFERMMPSSDRRHRQNYATLLSGAFVSLYGRIPNEDEAQQWALDHTSSVELHAEEIERDNSRECLEHLLKHEVEHFPLQHWIAVSMEDTGQGQPHFDALRIMALFDIVTRNQEGPDAGILLRNGSPAIEKIFTNTAWEGRGWERALRALDGAFKLKHPVYFSSGSKSRCIGIPLHYIPPAIETWARNDDY